MWLILPINIAIPLIVINGVVVNAVLIVVGGIVVVEGGLVVVKG
jgi:hypothetical protein